MCGFGGIINSKRGIEKELVVEIAGAVSYRGPDSTGTCLFKNGFEFGNESNHAIFFNRLAIIDLDARSNQPFQDEQYVLVFNGEIYNYQSLKKTLQTSGYTFKTSSDTEVLFYALQYWGTAAIEKLNGMFAFFWMNKKTQSFVIARDRVGIKPLYYAVKSNAFAFASEVDSVIALTQSEFKISQPAILQYLSLQYVPTPNSIVEGISKLPPGHFISGTVAELNNGKVPMPQAYWNAWAALNSQDSVRETDLEKILVESLRGQLVADVPVGMFLSSGVDSSLLTAIVNKHFRDNDYNFFTVAFDEKTDSDESENAIHYLKGFNNPRLVHHRLTLNSHSIAERLTDLYTYFDEPFADPAALLNWAISDKAREHVTVALSGDGADELFWGYNRYNEWRSSKSKSYKNIPGLRTIMQPVAGAISNERVKYTLLNRIESDPIHAHFNQLRPRAFGFLPPVENDHSLWFFQNLQLLKHRDDLPGVIDLKTYLPDAMLYKVDRASMASSLEIRVPYLDNEVIDYALHLPLTKKSNGSYDTKAPLKKLLMNLAPHYQMLKNKKGFSFPLEAWLRKEWKPLVLDSVNKQTLDTLGLPGDRMMKLVNSFYEKGANHVYEVWFLFNLTLWYTSFKTKHRPIK